MLFGLLYTKKDVVCVSSAVAEAAGSTLGTVVKTISTAKAALETPAQETFIAADKNEAAAQKAYQDAIKDVANLRKTAADQMVKAANKGEAIKLLTP